MHFEMGVSNWNFSGAWTDECVNAKKLWLPSRKKHLSLSDARHFPWIHFQALTVVTTNKNYIGQIQQNYSGYNQQKLQRAQPTKTFATTINKTYSRHNQLKLQWPQPTTTTYFCMRAAMPLSARSFSSRARASSGPAAPGGSASRGSGSRRRN